MVHTSGSVLADIPETETVRPLLRLLHQLHYLFTRTVCQSSIYNFYYKTIIWVQARPNTPFGQLFQVQNLAVLTGLSEVANPSQQRQHFEGQKWIRAKVTCILQVCFLCSPSLPPSCNMDWLHYPNVREKPEFTGKQGMLKTVLGHVGSQGPPGRGRAPNVLKTCTVAVPHDKLSICIPSRCYSRGKWLRCKTPFSKQLSDMSLLGNENLTTISNMNHLWWSQTEFACKLGLKSRSFWLSVLPLHRVYLL